MSGCGGGSSAPTKAQYVSKINAICVAEKQQLTQIALAKTKLPVTLERATALREQTLGQIEAVKRPSSEPIAPEWLALRRKALSLAKRIGALGLGARRAQPLNREYVTVTNTAERIALAYGITGCRGFSAV